jgi:gamma-glutamyl hydrolase
VTNNQKMKSIILLSFTLAVVLICCVNAAQTNNRPVIGVLAQPLSENQVSEDRNSYIAASYVKFIEGAGARVVPIPYDLPKQQLYNLFQQLNGLLFPGGGADLDKTPYYYTQEYLLNLAMTKGEFFPVWATCLGFEAVSIAAAGTYDILHSGFDSWNISMPLEFYPDAQSVRNNSRLFSRTNMPSDEMFTSFSQEAITLNNHHAGVLMKQWFANARLRQSFRVLSTNKDRNGLTFISTIEAVDCPVYATQCHPHKISYEWREYEEINHSYHSLLANQHMANFFVNECRKNTHQFKDEKELVDKWLIYNYTPVYSYKYSPDFEQSYYFPKSQF